MRTSFVCTRTWKRLDRWQTRGLHLNTSNAYAVPGATAPKDGGLQLGSVANANLSRCCHRMLISRSSNPQTHKAAGLSALTSCSFLGPCVRSRVGLLHRKPGTLGRRHIRALASGFGYVECHCGAEVDVRPARNPTPSASRQGLSVVLCLALTGGLRRPRPPPPPDVSTVRHTNSIRMSVGV